MGTLAAAAAGTGCATGASNGGAAAGRAFKTITIAKTDCLFEREPMVRYEKLFHLIGD